MDPFVPLQRPPVVWFSVWCRATRWERAVDRALRPLALGHTRYMLLDLAERIEARTQDAMSHRMLVDLTQLREPAVSYVMGKLTADGLVDRIPDGLDCRIWRVRVTSKGRELLSRARPVVDRVAAELSNVEIDLSVWRPPSDA